MSYVQFTGSKERVYHPGLDILRGLAISIVVFYHNFDNISFFRFGWIGVDLFFVLSGYLITDLLLKSREKKYFFRNFYIRRMLRILPLYYFVLLGFFLLVPYLFSDRSPCSAYMYFTNHGIWFWGFAQNWLFVLGKTPPIAYLTHFWTLAIEEQFYLCWPFAIFYISKNPAALKLLIIGLIMFAVILRINIFLHADYVEAYYCNTFTRMDSLLMGCLLAVHMGEGKRIPPGWMAAAFTSFVLLIVASLLAFGNVSQSNPLFATIGYSITALFFTALLYWMLTNENSLLRYTRRLQPLAFIGRISYGIYVYHLPIYLLVNYLILSYLNLSQVFYAHTIFISSLSIFLTLMASTISFYILEKPFLKLKRFFP